MEVSIPTSRIKKWHKLATQKTDVQKAIRLASGIGWSFAQIFGTPELTSQLFFFDGKVTRHFVEPDELRRALSEIAGKFENELFLATFKDNLISICDSSLLEAEKISSKASETYDNRELVRLFRAGETIWSRFYPWGWMLFFTSFAEVKRPLEKVFQRALKNAAEVSRAMKIVAKSPFPTPTAEAEKKILELLENVQKNKSKAITEGARKMAERFGWMSVKDIGDEARGADYYIAEAKRFIVKGTNPKESLGELARDEKNKAADFELLIDKLPKGIATQQVSLYHDLSYFREAREEYRNRLMIFSAALYRQIAEATGLASKELLYLTDEEIVNLLIGKIKDVKELRQAVRRRFKGYVMRFDKRIVTIIDNSHDINKFLKTLG